MLISELKQPLPKMCLVDGDWMVYRVGFASEEDDEALAKARLTELLTDICYFDLKCHDYEVYLTGSNNFRDKIAVTVPYKGNRDKNKRPKHYQALRDHFVRLGAVIVDGEEADDKVAIRMSQGDFVLVGVDKDLLQIPGWIYNPVKKEIQKIEPFEGLRNFYTQLLVGDRSDNIQGLKGIGPVKAAKILEKCTNEVELYRACVKSYEDKKEPPERVLENARLLWLRREEGQLWEPPSDPTVG
jgi:DNA polymerase-1